MAQCIRTLYSTVTERAAAIEQALGLTTLAWFVLGRLVEKGLLVRVASGVYELMEESRHE